MSEKNNHHRSIGLGLWFSRRNLWISLFVVVPVLTALGLIAWQRSRVIASDHLLDQIDSLVLLSPQDRTADEWSVAVYWTHNLHCASSPQIYAELSEIKRLQRDINERVESNVDTSTILWIWERYGALTESGDRYQKYQQVMLKEMERVAADGDTYGDYSSFAKQVRAEHK